MKKFLEEYGFAILAAIVVILLIAIATPVGWLIKNETMFIIESLTARGTNKSFFGDSSLSLTQNGEKLELYITNESTTDVLMVQFRYREKRAWSEWIDVGEVTNIQKKEYDSLPFELRNNIDVQARILDCGRGKQEKDLSNVLTYKGTTVSASSGQQSENHMFNIKDIVEIEFEFDGFVYTEGMWIKAIEYEGTEPKYRLVSFWSCNDERYYKSDDSGMLLTESEMQARGARLIEGSAEIKDILASTPQVGSRVKVYGRYYYIAGYGDNSSLYLVDAYRKVPSPAYEGSQTIILKSRLELDIASSMYSCPAYKYEFRTGDLIEESRTGELHVIEEVADGALKINDSWIVMDISHFAVGYNFDLLLHDTFIYDENGLPA